MADMLVVGGAGFIGSNFVKMALERGYQVTVLDALTYAGHLENLESCQNSNDYKFIKGDIRDFKIVRDVILSGQFDVIINFAAESHVDNSIAGPRPFLQTNVEGTFNLLESCREYREQNKNRNFLYLQVSTDEVFGELGDDGYFTEESSYHPRSPYSSTKAAADHLVRAWGHTYGLPVIITNCSNNYGPYQFPEKLIPVIITNALAEKPLPVYGEGRNVRDWIHVHDHCKGLLLAIEKGTPQETYCFGGRSERKNIDVVKAICALLDEIKPRSQGSYTDLITFVKDRAGHDWRYAIDDSKARQVLGFTSTYPNFEEGLKQTVNWYLTHQDWIQKVKGKVKK